MSFEGQCLFVSQKEIHINNITAWLVSIATAINLTVPNCNHNLSTKLKK